MDCIYKNDDFDSQQLSCEDCGWKGIGTDANIVDLYGVSDKNEVHCPECDAYLGCLQVED